MTTLKEARLKSNLTQGELARMSDLTLYVISHIELGKWKPRKSTKRRIETALNQLIDWQETFISGAARASKGKGISYYQEVTKSP